MVSKAPMITTTDGVYLDHNATTKVDPSLFGLVPGWMSQFGNPSSIHQASRGPRTLIREARIRLAEALKVSPLELVFNSGASEGNNTVVKAIWSLRGVERPEFLCSAVEHPSVTKAMQAIQKKGAIVHWIPVNKDGELDLKFVQAHLSTKTALISVMSANNETGTLFPVAQLVDMAKNVGAYVHSDCVQMFGKHALDLKKLGVDYATFSGHKFYSLKGAGFMYVKKTAPFENFIDGGAQERFRRGGTENTLGIAAMGHMAQKMVEMGLGSKLAELGQLRDRLESQLMAEIPELYITAQKSPRLTNTSHMMIAGIDAETLLINLDLDGFFVSTGAACSSGNPEPSPVLLAMGFTRSEAQTSLRVSLGWNSQSKDLDKFVQRLKEIVSRLRQMKKDSENVTL